MTILLPATIVDNGEAVCNNVGMTTKTTSTPGARAVARSMAAKKGAATRALQRNAAKRNAEARAREEADPVAPPDSEDWEAADWLYEASAQALAAHVALSRRDKAVRQAVALGVSKRKVAHETGLTPPAIDRILLRAGVASSRW